MLINHRNRLKEKSRFFAPIALFHCFHAENTRDRVNDIHFWGRGLRPYQRLPPTPAPSIISTTPRSWLQVPESCAVSILRAHRPRSIYQYSNLAPRLSGQNCKFFSFLLSINFEKRLGYKENNTKYGRLSWKPRSHVRILIYRTWTIACRKTKTRPFTCQLDYWASLKP